MRFCHVLGLVSAITACGGSEFTLRGSDAGTTTDGANGKDSSSADAKPEAARGCTAGSFPTFTDACTNDLSCIYKLHQINCCGSKEAIGLNHDEFTPFDTAEAAWEASCPSCSCPPAATVAQDGTMGNPTNLKVTCQKTGGAMIGVCRTTFN